MIRVGPLPEHPRSGGANRLTDKDQDQQNENRDAGGKEVNDPLTRTDVEAPGAEFEGNKPKED